MGRGGGTSVPGVVLLRINPRAVDTLAARLGGGSILVSATNGKTTTTRMLGGALRADGAEVITNGAGANLLSGVASALADARLGRPETARGLFECDEAALPEVMARLTPRALVLMNLFRDQLDRHGELEAISERWQAMLLAPGALPRLVLAADDPAIAALGDGRECLWFGLDSRTQPTPRDAGRVMPRSPTTTCGSGTSVTGAAPHAEVRARTSMWPSSTPDCGAPRGRIHASVHPMAR
jgi:lipid II isoglutaminyl synthase (glutamine-hydrolysing)